MRAFTFIASPLAALVFAPLVGGIINRVKAVFAGRRGPSVVQPYFDLIRLLKKQSVYSASTSWIFRAAPPIIFTSVLAATAFVPLLGGSSCVSFGADLVVMLYLLGIARFALILSALDTGSSFEGMGASREAFFSALAEPVAFICLATVMRAAGSHSIGAALASTRATDSITVLLSALPLFIVLLAENSRIPFDDPNTHLELTMVHEVMILDNSGPGLALLEYAAAVKLWLFSLIVASIILPETGLGAGQPALIMVLTLAIGVVVGVVESVMARLRLLKVPRLLFGAGVLAVLGYFISATDVLGM